MRVDTSWRRKVRIVIVIRRKTRTERRIVGETGWWVARARG